MPKESNLDSLIIAFLIIKPRTKKELVELLRNELQRKYLLVKCNICNNAMEVAESRVKNNKVKCKGKLGGIGDKRYKGSCNNEIKVDLNNTNRHVKESKETRLSITSNFNTTYIKKLESKGLIKERNNILEVDYLWFFREIERILLSRVTPKNWHRYTEESDSKILGESKIAGRLLIREPFLKSLGKIQQDKIDKAVIYKIKEEGINLTTIINLFFKRLPEILEDEVDYFKIGNHPIITDVGVTSERRHYPSEAILFGEREIVLSRLNNEEREALKRLLRDFMATDKQE